jgi:hypothetical protein
LLLFDELQRVRERHLAVAMMVAVRLAVGGDVDELRMRARVAERAGRRCARFSPRARSRSNATAREIGPS